MISLRSKFLAVWGRISPVTETSQHSLLDLGLSADTERAVRRWLDDPHYASERPSLNGLLAEVEAGSAAARAELLDAFSQVLPIGTGGRRGRVGPGPNRMNPVVVRETAQGVVEALKAAGDTPQVAIVYDTRMHSRQFAYAAAEQCAAGGLTVVLLDAPRPTPELSFLVRRMGCGAGIVVSASHNPPEDNGIKIYGPDGAPGAPGATATGDLSTHAPDPAHPHDAQGADADGSVDAEPTEQAPDGARSGQVPRNGTSRAVSPAP